MQKYSKEEILKKSLKKILAEQDVSQYQQLLKRLSAELQISILDCSAALFLLHQPNLYPNRYNKVIPSESKIRVDILPVLPKQKVVRYRLDIGTKHLVSQEEIKGVLVEVAGVESKQIGRLDVRNYYTLVDLPDGMPADIFQLLSEAEIRHQKLNIKRIKYQRRFKRRNHKKISPKPHIA